MLPAEDALRLGLVNYVVKPDELMNKCLEIAEKIKQQAPVAIAEIISCVNDCYSEKKDGFASEVNSFGKCFSTEDYKEGTTAFLEKRKAAFKGK